MIYTQPYLYQNAFVVPTGDSGYGPLPKVFTFFLAHPILEAFFSPTVLCIHNHSIATPIPYHRRNKSPTPFGECMVVQRITFTLVNACCRDDICPRRYHDASHCFVAKHWMRCAIPSGTTASTTNSCYMFNARLTDALSLTTLWCRDSFQGTLLICDMVNNHALLSIS